MRELFQSDVHIQVWSAAAGFGHVAEIEDVATHIGECLTLALCHGAGVGGIDQFGFGIDQRRDRVKQGRVVEAASERAAGAAVVAVDV